MNFKSTYETIKNSSLFKDFIEKNPNAELIAGFFILDFLSNENRRSLDYMQDDKIYTFSLNQSDEITMTEDKLIEQESTQQKLTPLTKINQIKIDLNEIPDIATKEAENNNVREKFQKIIAVLQNHTQDEENLLIWNLTCMLDGLVILNILVESET